MQPQMQEIYLSHSNCLESVSDRFSEQAEALKPEARAAECGASQGQLHTLESYPLSFKTKTSKFLTFRLGGRHTVNQEVHEPKSVMGEKSFQLRL